MKDDLISRQAVIDMLQSQAYDDWNQGASTTWANAFSECAEMIRSVPSAEPERTCEYWDSESNFCTLCRPSAQPSVSDCLGCNCPKMERLKEQKTFSEMVRLHDAETHCGAYMRGGEK